MPSTPGAIRIDLQRNKETILLKKNAVSREDPGVREIYRLARPIEETTRERVALAVMTAGSCWGVIDRLLSRTIKNII